MKKTFHLVCDKRMKGSYKSFPPHSLQYGLVCDKRMKGSYKVESA